MPIDVLGTGVDVALDLTEGQIPTVAQNKIATVELKLWSGSEIVLGIRIDRKVYKLLSHQIVNALNSSITDG